MRAPSGALLFGLAVDDEYWVRDISRLESPYFRRVRSTLERYGADLVDALAERAPTPLRTVERYEGAAGELWRDHEVVLVRLHGDQPVTSLSLAPFSGPRERVVAVLTDGDPAYASVEDDPLGLVVPRAWWFRRHVVCVVEHLDGLEVCGVSIYGGVSGSLRLPYSAGDHGGSYYPLPDGSVVVVR